MDEQKAREILGNVIQADDSLDCIDSYDFDYTVWSSERTTVTLDGHFSVERLEAIAWWMKNKGR